MLQSQNEALVQSVRSLKSRVRELEDALGKTQAQLSPQPHPLLEGRDPSNEPDTIPACDEVKDEVDEASQLVGSLSIGEQGQARFHGQSSASEVAWSDLGLCVFQSNLLCFQSSFFKHCFRCVTSSSVEVDMVIFLSNHQNSEDDPLRILHPPNTYHYGLPQSIIDLINAFPFCCVTPEPEVKAEILRYLPNHNKALAITLVYFEHAGCSYVQFTLVVSAKSHALFSMIRRYQVLQQDKFVPLLFDVLLQSTRGLTVGEKLHAHQLAVIYLVLALGSILSEDPNDRAESQKYHLLASAAMSMSPIVKEATSPAVEALFLMIQYFNHVDSPACDRQWLCSGVMLRLAYSVSGPWIHRVMNLTSDPRLVCVSLSAS